MDKERKYDGMKNNENLYDIAMNVMTLRNRMGECKIIRGWCEEHNLNAIRTSKTEQAWTRNKKTEFL